MSSSAEHLPIADGGAAGSTARQRRRAAAGPAARATASGAAVAAAMPRYVVCGSLISILMGYDLGVLSAALDSVQTYFHLTNGQLAWLAGSFSFAEVVSAPLASIIADVFGRRSVLLVSIMVTIVGAVTMAAAPTYEALMAGRIIAGLGVGAGGSQASVYLAEMSPSHLRGFNVGQIEVWFNVGILLGFLLGLGCKKYQPPTDFRVMFAVGAGIAFLVFPAVARLPESPRWLLSKKREAEAVQILLENTTEEEANRTVKDLKLEMENNSSWRDFFGLEALHCALVAVSLSALLSFTGLEAVSYYSDKMLRESGMDNEDDRSRAMVVLAVFKIIMICLAAVNMDRVGRVWCMRVSLGGMTAALVAFLIPGMLAKSAILACAGIFSFSSAYSLGAGPGFFILTAEIWPMRMRAVGSGFMQGIRNLCNALCTIYFLVLADRTSFAFVLALCAMTCLLGSLTVQNIAPETKGRSLEEIAATHTTSMRTKQRRSSIELAASMATGDAWGDRGVQESPQESPQDLG